MSRGHSVTWQLLLDRPRSGKANMEIDRFLLSQAESSSRPATFLRFYTWETPTVSLGQHQKPELAVDLKACREAGVDIVGRPTGGRAVLHDAEITYAVVSNDPAYFPHPQVDRTYHQIAVAVSHGLRKLGVAVELALQPLHREGSYMRNGMPCFVTASRHEILWQGRKLVGSAQRRVRNAFLQHGAIPLELNWDLMARIFRVSPESLRSRMVGLREAGVTASAAQIQDRLAGAFAERFGVELQRTQLEPVGTRAGFETVR